MSSFSPKESKGQSLHRRFQKFTEVHLSKGEKLTVSSQKPSVRKITLIWLSIGLLTYGLSIAYLQSAERNKNQLVSTGFLTTQMINNHFYLAAQANGFGFRFLVDTGATVTAFPRHMMNKLGVTHCASFGVSNTANGKVKVCKATLPNLTIGPFNFNNVKIHFMPDLHEPLLGMNILKRFQMTQSGGVLTLRANSNDESASL